MASKILDDPDGLYLENDDSLDEVDATKIFKVTDVEAIAPNFARDVAKNAPWKRQRTNRSRSVYKNWGSVLESEIKDSDLSVLLTVEGEPLTDSSAKEQGQMAQDALAGAYCQTTRWDDSHLMLHLPNYDIYTKLGQLLSENKVKAVENIAISSLEGANMCNPPRVFIEHTCRQREPLLSSLVSVVLPFSPAFTFLELFVDSTITVTPPAPTPSFAPMSLRESVPNLCLTMLFEGGSQRLAQRSLESIVGPPWHAVPLNSDVLTDLDTGLSYHRNSHGGPMWGIKTGCPQAGVQLTLFINDLASFDAMVRFYQALLDLKPLSKIQTDHGIVYRVFPISARGELMLLHIPGLETHPAPHVALCLGIDNLRLLPPEVTPSHKGRWNVQDPNGNHISLLQVLK